MSGAMRGLACSTCTIRMVPENIGSKILSGIIVSENFFKEKLFL